MTQSLRVLPEMQNTCALRVSRAPPSKLAQISAKKMLQKGASVERFAAEWRHSWKRPTWRIISIAKISCLQWVKSDSCEDGELVADARLIALAWSWPLTWELIAATFGKES